MSKSDHREDCYFYFEDHDMGATVTCCAKQHEYGYCPCKNCENYFSKKDVSKLVNTELERRKKEKNDEKETNGRNAS